MSVFLSKRMSFGYFSAFYGRRVGRAGVWAHVSNPPPKTCRQGWDTARLETFATSHISGFASPHISLVSSFFIYLRIVSGEVRISGSFGGSGWV